MRKEGTSLGSNGIRKEGSDVLKAEPVVEGYVV